MWYIILPPIYLRRGIGLLNRNLPKDWGVQQAVRDIHQVVVVPVAIRPVTRLALLSLMLDRLIRLAVEIRRVASLCDSNLG